MICETCKHRGKADDEWSCKYCAPDDRRYEEADFMAKQPQEVVDLARKLLKAAGKQSPITLMKALLLCM